jgi:hypothetical protein
MQRFFICLFIVLGVFVTSLLIHQPQAIALPSQSISYGQNPIVNIGGSAYNSETKTIFAAPSDQDIIITDIILTSFSGSISCKASHKSEFILTTGPVLGQFETETGFYNGSNGGSTGLSIQHAFQSGIRIPAGTSLTFFVTSTGSHGSGCSSSNAGVRYMISGYYAQL